MAERTFGIGLIGCGGFGLFCGDIFSGMPNVRMAAVADVDARAVEAAAKRFGCHVAKSAFELVARDDVDLVHVAAPPAMHYELALGAMRAGKHVLCEKPLALNTAQADEMLAVAKQADVLCTVNFIKRHNAVADLAKAVIDSGLLGGVLAGRMTNCATDSHLPPGHWFWDKSVSGGIFIEHGVHFFDLYAKWLGSGRVIGAHAETRPNTQQEDRVTCTLRYDCGAVVGHYHGFDQIEPMDRAEHHLVCEMGDLRVYGWIPLTLEVYAAVDDAGAERLGDLLDGAEVDVLETFPPHKRQIMGGGKLRNVTKRIKLTYCPNPDKQDVYAESIRALLVDQTAWIRDRSHARRVTEQNGLDALALAQSAEELVRVG